LTHNCANFCGWFCPEGALFEYADFLTFKILGRRSIYGRKRNDPQGMEGGHFPLGITVNLRG
jgi:hypothetical protein